MVIPGKKADVVFPESYSSIFTKDGDFPMDIFVLFFSPLNSLHFARPAAAKERLSREARVGWHRGFRGEVVGVFRDDKWGGFSTWQWFNDGYPLVN